MTKEINIRNLIEKYSKLVVYEQDRFDEMYANQYSEGLDECDARIKAYNEILRDLKG